jgi:DeoR/GlpR family transcriptional regulator of sugar metabolism
MQAVSKKGKIDNREAQKLLRISDKTAERYLNKLVAQGRLKRSGAGRDVIYTLPR